ncbi:MAG: 4Fe-4S dicluster domain-containing protein [Methylobacteriaceae bacterium]|nr:4Fe-4S dicluster domain-containing protein [Methylobacteriaceae bacterium]
MRRGDGGLRDTWWRSTGHSDRTAERPAHEQLALDRRHALKLMAGIAAMQTTACSAPPEEIVPYVRMPERLVIGNPLRFATSLALNGYARPVIVESHEGRPTKVEGNPDHPASRGATDAFAQAAILSLYDPGRSRVILQDRQISNWDALLKAVTDVAPTWRSDGSRLRILSGVVTSPTLASQIATVLDAYPGARWHRWQPVNADEVRRGAELAFGRRLEPRYRLDQARTVLSLDADLLGNGPEQVRHAHDFSGNRRARRGTSGLTSLYVAEPTLTLTGAQADRRLPLARSAVLGVARALAARWGAPLQQEMLPTATLAFVEAVGNELLSRGSDALVAVGEGQPAEVHALGHWLNERIGALGHGVEMIAPVEADPVDHVSSIKELLADMNAGRVDALVIIGGNPAFDAPADLGFGDALKAVRLTIRHGLHDDETSELCHWHVPALHELESWGDLAAPDGAIGIVQPLITRLYDGRSPHELLAALVGRLTGSTYEIVRDTWRARANASDFESWWRSVLRDGFIRGTRHAAVAVGPARLPRLQADIGTLASGGFEIVFSPDPAAWDGSFAENAWLQELPRPFTKLTWGNAAHMAPKDAQALGIADGDRVLLSVDRSQIEIPAAVMPGQVSGTIALTLGCGRRAGAIARDIGTDVYPLRTTASLWNRLGIVLSRGSGHVVFPTTQGERMEGRDLVRSLTSAEFASGPPYEEALPVSLYTAAPKRTQDPYAWAMVIDQSVCIGCNACIAACQAENNTPVVGPDEIRNHRDMHWLRVDVYFRSLPEAPAVAFQPVPCMHCEKAPCEPVCPVEASVHDSEGLNVQVYNRCIGTRFCQANCPYKVRRFNFYGYADGQEYSNLGDPLLEAVHNPDVSVRARGVMEKCTYCVQRISRARRSAEKEDRIIADGEVVTACQQACPVDALVFGNLNDPSSRVSRLRHEPHHYALLGELGTRPRTTYLAQVRQAFPDRSAPPGRTDE